LTATPLTLENLIFGRSSATSVTKSKQKDDSTPTEERRGEERRGEERRGEERRGEERGTFSHGYMGERWICVHSYQSKPV